jgi:hypothetical protein
VRERSGCGVFGRCLPLDHVEGAESPVEELDEAYGLLVVEEAFQGSSDFCRLLRETAKRGYAVLTRSSGEVHEARRGVERRLEEDVRCGHRQLESVVPPI